MVASLLTAQAWRTKYLSPTAFQRAVSTQRTAVVVGATSGIGEACAHRLAEQGFTVVAVGRDRPGRAEQVVQALTEKSNNSNNNNNISKNGQEESPNHEFYACDAFSLQAVYETGQQIQRKHPKIDALVLSQGMATTQGFTPTKEGNDEKLTLHYYSRICLIQSLLPALLKKSSDDNNTMPAVVVSILSGGVHSPYQNYATDPSLRDTYSIPNAANAAGYYNDLGLEQCAMDHSPTSNIHFVHASPGFVNTNWGTEFHPLLRGIVRLLQPLGRKPSECAEYLMGSTVLAVEAGDALPSKDKNNNSSKVWIVGQYGQPLEVTKGHTEEARKSVWNHTMEVFKKAGVPVAPSC